MPIVGHTGGPCKNFEPNVYKAQKCKHCAYMIDQHGAEQNAVSDNDNLAQSGASSTPTGIKLGVAAGACKHFIANDFKKDKCQECAFMRHQHAEYAGQNLNLASSSPELFAQKSARQRKGTKPETEEDPVSSADEQARKSDPGPCQSTQSTAQPTTTKHRPRQSSTMTQGMIFKVALLGGVTVVAVVILMGWFP